MAHDQETGLKSPRILLIGIGGVYNYGCEAIVRGTEALIHERWPNAQIFYASPCPEDDRRRLAGVNIDVILRKRIGRYSPTNVIRKLLNCGGIQWRPRVDSMSMLNGVDAVLSIGGDIYTLYPDGGYPKSLMKFGDAVVNQRKDYVLWGASVGPFSSVPWIEKDVQTHLLRLSLISAREHETIDYLRGIGVTDNVVRCADPAFVVAPHILHQPHYNGAITIGLNLSPLSVRHLRSDLTTTIRNHADGIQKLIRQIGCKILLIPHVICRFNEGDDDLRYLQNIRNALAPSFRQQVELFDDDTGFVETKKELIKCDMVIAARMHCAINAIAAGVPTILLSYSRKAVGMGEYVYGSKDWVVSLSEFNGENMIRVVCRMLESRETISSGLDHRMHDVQIDARGAMSSLAGLFG